MRMQIITFSNKNVCSADCISSIISFSTNNTHVSCVYELNISSGERILYIVGFNFIKSFGSSSNGPLSISTRRRAVHSTNLSGNLDSLWFTNSNVFFISFSTFIAISINCISSTCEMSWLLNSVMSWYVFSLLVMIYCL